MAKKKKSEVCPTCGHPISSEEQIDNGEGRPWWHYVLGLGFVGAGGALAYRLITRGVGEIGQTPQLNSMLTELVNAPDVQTGLETEKRIADLISNNYFPTQRLASEKAQKLYELEERSKQNASAGSKYVIS